MKLILKEDGAEMIRVNTKHVCECVSVSLSSCCVMHTALLPEINRFTQRVDTTQFEKLTKVGAQTSTRRTPTKDNAQNQLIDITCLAREFISN